MGTTVEVLKVDAFGTAICVDNLIAYAVRRGPKMWLKRLKVTEVTIEYVRGYDPDDVRMRYNVLTIIQAKNRIRNSGSNE